MLDAELKAHIQNTYNIKIKQASVLTGGDINAVYLLETSTEKLVIKVKDAKRYPKMFAAEKAGLETLRSPKVIDVPKPIASGEFQDLSYLLLEYKASAKKNPKFWTRFGEQLAQLHKQSNATFGYSQNNYIGSLPQYNAQSNTAGEFYIDQRLKPQFTLAKQNGFTFNDLEAFYKKIKTIIPEEAPALVHGDLWSGNYLVNHHGDPCLIDPAVAYAPREMDIAMMHLFGGFEPQLFSAYNAVFPLLDGWQDRIKLWQLYYIMVHLNLFGRSYLASAKAILKQYS